MAMAITMGMVAWVFVFATEVMVTQGPLSSVHYTLYAYKTHTKVTLISSEISLASASTVRARFGCIFKATTECAT